jgi:hypothetical protein
MYTNDVEDRSSDVLAIVAIVLLLLAGCAFFFILGAATH